MAEPLVATYSIVACDVPAGQWGVAVQSKFLAVGSVVPWAEPEVGAIATQSYANPRYGPDRRLLRGPGKHPRLGRDRGCARSHVRVERPPRARAAADRVPRRGAGRR